MSLESSMELPKCFCNTEKCSGVLAARNKNENANIELLSLKNIQSDASKNKKNKEKKIIGLLKANVNRQKKKALLVKAPKNVLDTAIIQ